GTTSTQLVTSHTYSTAGNFTVTLTTTDDEGASTSVTTTANITSASQSQTLTFKPQDDSWNWSGAPDTNYGTSTHLYTHPGDSDSYLQFAVTGVTGTVNSAKLRLYVIGGSSIGLAVYLVDNAWTTTGMTWNNRPRRLSGVLASIPGPVASGSWI